MLIITELIIEYAKRFKKLIILNTNQIEEEIVESFELIEDKDYINKLLEDKNDVHQLIKEITESCELIEDQENIDQLIEYCKLTKEETIESYEIIEDKVSEDIDMSKLSKNESDKMKELGLTMKEIA